MNELDKIYQEFGDDICLFPFLSVFYGNATTPYMTPCSLIQEAKHWPIDRNNLIKTLNAQQWIDLRKNFIKSSCHTAECCKKCSDAELNGGTSARQLNNQYFAEHITTNIVEEIKQIQKNNYKVDHVLSLDYFPSNYCNYECIMCSGEASSSRKVFEIKVLGAPNTKVAKNITTDDFYSVLDHVEIINFTGGETILQSQVIELINYLIEHNLTNKTISLLTNASSYPEKHLQLFKEFKNVFYTVSIDGTGDVIEYQRRGAEWATVSENAIRINQEFGAVVNYVLTAVNVFRFADFLKWAYFNKLDKVVVSLVFNTDYLKVSVIPDDLKITLIQQLEDEKSLFTGKYLLLIEQVISILKEARYDPDLFAVFKKRILTEDSCSKKSLIEIIPEWRPYFND